MDKSIRSDGLYINIIGESVSRISFTVPKDWKSIDHIDDGGKYTRNKYINRNVNREQLDVSWVWLNSQSMVKVSNVLVPSDKAGDKSITIEAMIMEVVQLKL